VFVTKLVGELITTTKGKSIPSLSQLPPELAGSLPSRAHRRHPPPKPVSVCNAVADEVGQCVHPHPARLSSGQSQSQIRHTPLISPDNSIPVPNTSSLDVISADWTFFGSTAGFRSLGSLLTSGSFGFNRHGKHRFNGCEEASLLTRGYPGYSLPAGSNTIL